MTEELFKEGLKINVLVITENWDTVHSPDHDLTKLEVVLRLLDMILSGWFDGGHCSPPCCSFSKVLHKPPGPGPGDLFPHGPSLTFASSASQSRCRIFQQLVRPVLSGTAALSYKMADLWFNASVPECVNSHRATF